MASKKIELKRVIEVSNPEAFRPEECRESHIFVSCGKLSQANTYVDMLKRSGTDFILAVTHGKPDGICKLGNEDMRLFTVFVAPLRYEYKAS